MFFLGGNTLIFWFMSKGKSPEIKHPQFWQHIRKWHVRPRLCRFWFYKRGLFLNIGRYIHTVLHTAPRLKSDVLPDLIFLSLVSRTASVWIPRDQAPVCLGPVFLPVTPAEQRCDTISPGVYPSLQPFARRGLLWTVHLLWAAVRSSVCSVSSCKQTPRIQIQC